MAAQRKTSLTQHPTLEQTCQIGGNIGNGGIEKKGLAKTATQPNAEWLGDSVALLVGNAMRITEANGPLYDFLCAFTSCNCSAHGDVKRCSSKNMFALCRAIRFFCLANGFLTSS